MCIVFGCSGYAKNGRDKLCPLSEEAAIRTQRSVFYLDGVMTHPTTDISSCAVCIDCYNYGKNRVDRAQLRVGRGYSDVDLTDLCAAEFFLERAAAYCTPNAVSAVLRFLATRVGALGEEEALAWAAQLKQTAATLTHSSAGKLSEDDTAVSEYSTLLTNLQSRLARTRWACAPLLEGALLSLKRERGDLLASEATRAYLEHLSKLRAAPPATPVARPGRGNGLLAFWDWVPLAPAAALQPPGRPGR